MAMSSHCALRITLSVILVGITVDAVPVVQEKSAQLPLSDHHVTDVDMSSETPWVSVPAARGIVATQLAVVINAADAQSVTVGTAYAAARHVPAANVVTLNFSTGSILSHDEFAKVVCTVSLHTRTLLTYHGRHAQAGGVTHVRATFRSSWFACHTDY
jgi:hypothetical protein